MRILLRLLSVLLLAGAGTQAWAGSADLEGTLTYSIDRDRITIEIERIANNTTDTTTGTLYVTVWMTANSDIYSTGYQVARHRITGSSNGQLGPGQYFSDIRWTLDYEAPPPGTYYVHFFTSQHPEPNTVLDSRTFTGTIDVAERGGSADIEGRIAYTISGDRITVEIDRIANNTSNTTTGTLYVTVWMTTRNDVFSTGYRVARHRITGDSNGRLDPGHYFGDIRWTLDFSRPPAGTYYVHFYTSQHPEPDTVLDSRTFTNTRDIGGGGGGGGDDHGNSRSTATRVALPSTTTGTIDPGNDTDWFRFEVRARGAVVMESSGDLDTLGTLFDASGNRVVQDDDGGERLNFRIERTLDAGTYYVRVHSYQRATGGYTLHLRGDPDDPNVDRIDDVDLGIPAQCGLEVEVCVRDYACEDGDEVRVSVNNAIVFEGEIFNRWQCASVPVNEGANSISFLALNGTGFKGACDFADVNTGELRITARGGDAETQRWRHSGGAGSEANLEITVGPRSNASCSLGTDDDTDGGGGGNDHGNSPATATRVALPSTTTGTIDPGNDTDWFRFEVSARGAVVMESSGDLDTLGTLFDARGNRVVQDDDGGERLNFRIERTLEAGTYYVRVHSYQRATGGYTLHLRTTSGGGGGGGGGDDHGNSRSTATPVALPSTTAGTIDLGNDTDYFRFAVSARGAVVMESSGDLDTYGTLFDASGNRMVQDDDGAGYPNFRIERTLDAGTYYVRVHSAGRTTGPYTLHLSATSGGGPNESVSIAGSVIDYFTGDPIPNATIQLTQYHNSVSRRLGQVRSNTVGAYQATVEAISPGRINLRATASGFASQSKVIEITDSPEAELSVTLRMVPSQKEVSFQAADGVDVDVEGQRVISLPPSGLVDATGEVVTGQVMARLTILDPSSESEIMPGDFLSTNGSTGELMPIESFGAMNVELLDGTGEAVRLGSGQVATVSVPLADRRSPTNGPATVPLYYWSDEMGSWVEEGEATLRETSPGQWAYVGSVNRIRTWNADAAFETTTISGCVNDRAGDIAQGARVIATGVDYIGRSETTVDAQGRFDVMVRPNSEVLLTATQSGLSSTRKLRTERGIMLTECLVVDQSAASITLTWGRAPSDLDSHLWGPDGDGGEFHVSYVVKTVNIGSATVALDVDDTSSFGPEIITISSFPSEGRYRYSVQNYSGDGSIVDSPARVELNLAGEVYVFSPARASGTPTRNWAVFDIEVGTDFVPRMVSVQQFTDQLTRTPHVDGIAAFSVDADDGEDRGRRDATDQEDGSPRRANPMTTLVERKYYVKP